MTKNNQFQTKTGGSYKVDQKEHINFPSNGLPIKNHICIHLCTQLQKYKTPVVSMYKTSYIIFYSLYVEVTVEFY